VSSLSATEAGTNCRSRSSARSCDCCFCDAEFGAVTDNDSPKLRAPAVQATLSMRQLPEGRAASANSQTPSGSIVLP
jgi:hypothetical protein